MFIRLTRKHALLLDFYHPRVGYYLTWSAILKGVHIWRVSLHIYKRT